MKAVICFCLVLFLSSFVFAVSSEVVADFYISSGSESELDYVRTPTFWGSYGGYISIVAVALIVGIVFFKSKNSPRPKKKRSSSRVKRKK
jgi:hypothetical protein